MRLAFVFPGQGSQRVGMGRAWAEAHPVARQVFDAADDALGLPLGRLCWEGPEDELQLTANTQPAILTASLAIQRVLAERGLEPVAVAGHSLGEYSALVAAGALDLADALRLVRARGEAMQRAVPVGQGAMAAILGLDVVVVNEIAEEAAGDDLVCTVANFNSPHQTVIAGHTEAVEHACRLASQRGARRAVALPVSAPFHSPLMEPARLAMTPLLEAAEIADPSVPVVTNIDATPAMTGEEVRAALIRQIDGPVRWVESVRSLAERLGIDTFLEVGPGNVLTGLVKRILPGVRAVPVGEPDGLDALLEELSDAAREAGGG